MAVTKTKRTEARRLRSSANPGVSHRLDAVALPPEALRAEIERMFEKIDANLDDVERRMERLSAPHS